MKGLFIKDLRLLAGKNMFLPLLVIAVVTLGFTGNGPDFIIPYFTLIISMFAVSTISYDESDNCFPFLFTLPATRNQYVQEKYLFGIVLGLCGDIFSSAAAYIISAVKGHPALSDTAFGFISVIPVFLLINALSLPFLLKLGMEKGRIAMFIIGGAAVGIAAFFGKNEGADAALNEFAESVQKNETMMILIFTAVSVVLTAVSYFISLGIMKKKEL